MHDDSRGAIVENGKARADRPVELSADTFITPLVALELEIHRLQVRVVELKMLLSREISRTQEAD